MDEAFSHAALFTRRETASRARSKSADGPAIFRISEPASRGAPPGPVESRGTAGLLAHGSSRPAAFPVAQWLDGTALSAYSCGGSRGLGAEPRTAFPFALLTRDRHGLTKGPCAKACQSFCSHSACFKRANRTRMMEEGHD